MRGKVWEYVVVHTPKDESEPEDIIEGGFVLATDADQARAVVITEELTSEDQNKIRELEILIRPFGVGSR